MTRRSVSVLPVAYPPLDRQPCERCGRLGVRVVALWVEGEDQVPHEALFCSTDCASFAGWPWLPPSKPERRRAAR